MKTEVPIGSYLPLNSVLHRLDPRTKLIGLAAALTAVFWSHSPGSVLAVSLPALILVVTCQVGWRIWFLSMWRFSVMLAVVLGLNVFLTSQGRPVVIAQFELPITWEGLETALVFTMQIVLAIVIALILTFTTSPTELSRGVESLAQPLKKLRVPVDDLGMIVLLAMRFVPLLQQELNLIIDAQKSRGVEFGKGGISTRARNLVAVLSPVLTGSLRRADVLAQAMTARGFRPGAKRTQYRPLKFRRIDAIAALALLLFLVCRFALLP